MLVLAIVALRVPLALSLRDRVDAEVKLQARSQAEVVAARASPLHRAAADAGAGGPGAPRARRDVRGRVIVVGRAGRRPGRLGGRRVRSATSTPDRPEIATALGGDVAQRAPQPLTLGEDILATAVPILSGTARPAGAVRVTQSVAAVNRAVLRTWLALGLHRAARPRARARRRASSSPGGSRARSCASTTPRGASPAGDLSVRAQVEGSTEQQALARAFNEMTARLQTLLAVQREFVADASHQLRTPLTGLRLRLEEARSEPTTPQQAEDLDAALGEVDRLARIVTDLLELSRAGEDGRVAATTDAARRGRAARASGSRAPAAGRRVRRCASTRAPSRARRSPGITATWTASSTCCWRTRSPTPPARRSSSRRRPA